MPYPGGARFIGSFCGIAALGCGVGVTATPLRASPRALVARPPETVEVFASGAPTRAHVDVTILEAAEADSTAEQVQALRQQAARMGCDGLVLGGHFSREDVVLSLLAQHQYESHGLSSTCIVYTDAGSDAPAPLVAAPAPPVVAPAPQPPQPAASAERVWRR